MKKFLILLFMFFWLLSGCSYVPENIDTTIREQSGTIVQTENTFGGQEYSEFVTILNGNQPELTKEETVSPFIRLSELDTLGRCGVAYAMLGSETLPTEERGEIGHIKPSGWHTVKYDCVDGKYLYNRCHLLAFCLTGLNDDDRNLITGTRQFNNEGMLPYEEMVVRYIEDTGNHVLYRVEPVYTDNNLVADGVHMEGLSVEDDTICFNVFIANIQDGVSIDYATGESVLNADVPVAAGTGTHEAKEQVRQTYIANKNTKKLHLSSCDSVSDMKPKNRKELNDTYENLMSMGYEPCQRCLGE